MSKNNLQYFLLGLILLVHGLLLTKLIFFPYPELFIYPYLTNHGLLPYSQILDQHFPGLMFLPINFDNLGMTTPEIARIWLITVVILTHLLLFFISRDIFKSNKKALLVNFLYLAWQPFFEGWVLWIDSFLPLLLLPAFYALYKGKFFSTGILLGIAIVFKQTIIPLSFLILIYIFWKSHKLKDHLRFLGGLLIPVGLMVAYFIGIGVFWDFWYWTVVFNLTIFAKEGRGVGPTLAHFSRVLLVFGSAFIVIRRIKTKEAQILLIFLIGALLGLSTRFDFVHFQPALPFAILATILGLSSIKSKKSLGIFMLIYLLITAWWINIFYKGHIGNKVFFFDDLTYQIAGKIMHYTKPKDKIFVFGSAPHLYQMSNTLPAGDIFVFQFPWFFQAARDRILVGIKQDKPDIIISDRTVKIEDIKITDFAKEIDKYIQENYQKIDAVGTAEILKRK